MVVVCVDAHVSLDPCASLYLRESESINGEKLNTQRISSACESY